MVHLNFNENALHRSASGSVWGEIFVTIESEEFPGKNWTDLVSGVLRWWLEKLTELMMNKGGTVELPFMDGPYSLMVHLSETNSLSISAIEKRDTPAVVFSDVADVRSFLSELVAASSKLIEECEEKGWINADCEAIRSLIVQSKTS